MTHVHMFFERDLRSSIREIKFRSSVKNIKDKKSHVFNEIRRRKFAIRCRRLHGISTCIETLIAV